MARTRLLRGHADDPGRGQPDCRIVRASPMVGRTSYGERERTSNGRRCVIDERDGRIAATRSEHECAERIEQRLGGARRYPTTQLVRTDLVVMRMLEDAGAFVRRCSSRTLNVPYVRRCRYRMGRNS